MSATSSEEKIPSIVMDLLRVLLSIRWASRTVDGPKRPPSRSDGQPQTAGEGSETVVISQDDGTMNNVICREKKRDKNPRGTLNSSRIMACKRFLNAI